MKGRQTHKLLNLAALVAVPLRCTSFTATFVLLVVSGLGVWSWLSLRSSLVVVERGGGKPGESGLW